MHHAVGAAEFGRIHFRRQIVVIENEALAEWTPETAEQPIGLRWIAGLNDVETAATGGHGDRAHGRANEAPCEFGREPEGALRPHWQCVAKDVDILQALVRVFVPLEFRTDDAHRITGPTEGRRLEPDAAIERHWKVLHDDEGAASLVTSRYHDSALPMPVYWTTGRSPPRLDRRSGSRSLSGRQHQHSLRPRRLHARPARPAS